MGEKSAAQAVWLGNDFAIVHGGGNGSRGNGEAKVRVRFDSRCVLFSV
jgi:hypothetical protein